MNLLLAPGISIALLLAFAPSSPAQPGPASGPAVPARGGELAALEKKLLGTWQGPDCGGDFTFKADGTFELRNFTPGQYAFTGTWSLRWDALPATLLLTFKTSDFRNRDVGRVEHPFVGKTLEAKLFELGSDALAFDAPGVEWKWHNLPRAGK